MNKIIILALVAVLFALVNAVGINKCTNYCTKRTKQYPGLLGACIYGCLTNGIPSDTPVLSYEEEDQDAETLTSSGNLIDCAYNLNDPSCRTRYAPYRDVLSYDAEDDEE
jgi:hypothetical protein